MPRALTTIEKASTYLEEACKEMKMDPYSQNGRDRLITGSRGILQGTTAMLVAFDESQVNSYMIYSDELFTEFYNDSYNQCSLVLQKSTFNFRFESFVETAKKY